MSKVKYVTIKEVNFKERRRKSGLSLRELGKRTGIDFTYLSRFESGEATLSASAWERIKKELWTNSSHKKT